MYTLDIYITEACMVRTQVYLTEEEKRGLESAAVSQGISQSDLVRQAIDDLLAKIGEFDRGAILEDVSGIWAKRRDIPDIRSLRKGWRRRPSR